MVKVETRTEADAEPQPRAPSRFAKRPRVVAAGMLAVFVAAAVQLARLGNQENGGPPHVDTEIGAGIPATLYVPGEIDRDAQQALPDALPPGERPPVIVLAHGFSADRAFMSTLARSLTAHGYAVVAFDFRGHGANRNDFRAGADELRDDLDAVVDFAETWPHGDPDRLVLMGHSMGAGAVLDFATRDARAAAVVPISGGWTVDGPLTPDDVLFVVAENDPDGIRRSVTRLDGRLRGRGADVDTVEIGGTDHITVLWSGTTVNEIVDRLDGLLGASRLGTRGRIDARLGTALVYLLLALVLIAGAGWVSGRLAPRPEPTPGRGTAGGLLVLAIALVAAAPLQSLGGPAGFLSLSAGDVAVANLALAGAGVLAARLLAQRGALAGVPASWFGPEGPLLPGLGRLVAPAAVGAVAVYALLSPLGPVFHRLVPTPERLVAAVVAGALHLPFFLAFETLLRRGRPLTAALYGVTGRVVTVAALALAIRLGLVPGVVSLFLPILLVFFVFLEIFAAAAYATARNPRLIALVESALLGWLTAAALPIGF